MSREEQVRELIDGLLVDELVRIDAGLEGDWSDSVSTVWTRDAGVIGLDSFSTSHLEHIPSVELIFPDHWVGMHCFLRQGDLNAFDERLAMTVVELVERRLAS